MIGERKAHGEIVSGPCTLAELARDPDLIGDSAPPRFAWAMLELERIYLDALADGDPDELETPREKFRDALVAQLERLASDQVASAADDARASVIRARLDALDRGEAPAPGQRARPASLSRELSQPTTYESHHRDDVQGLRAVAVLIVALGHAGLTVLGGGYVGVDVFFVLSGFLITGLLLHEASERLYVSLVGFYLRRARRILPAAMLTLLVSNVAIHVLLNYVRAKQYLQDSVASALFSANFHFAAIGTDYFAHGQPPSPFQHYWSLAVEEQFYLVWPALLAIILGLSLRKFAPRPLHLSKWAPRRLLIAVAVIAIGSLAWSVHYTQANPAGAYFSTLTRIWELGLGAILAINAPRIAKFPQRWSRWLGWIGLAFIAVAATTFSASTRYPGYAALLPTIGAALIIGAGIGSSQLRWSASRVLAIAPLRYIGDRSYAFYLWHWPVLVIVAQYEGRNLSTGVNILLLLGAFALSVVSYRLVDHPLRTASWTMNPRSIVAWVALVASVLILADTWITSIDSKEAAQQIQANVAPALLSPASSSEVSSAVLPSAEIGDQLPAVVSAVGELATHHSLPSSLNPPVGALLQNIVKLPGGCFAWGHETSASVCHLGDVHGQKRLVVIGDSHAEMWMPAVLFLARVEHWLVVPLMKSACSPNDWTSSVGSADCQGWFRWAIQQDRALNPAVTLVAGDYSYGGTRNEQPLISGLTAAVTGTESRSSRVVMIGDVPYRTQQPVDCLLAANASPASCSEPLTLTEADLTNVASSVALEHHAAFIDTTGWFCYRSQCPLVVGNLITFRDSNHVSRTYATALSGVFRSAFDRALSALK